MTQKKKTSEMKRTKKVRTGDTVVVIAGNCKGQTGTVLRYIGEKVVVQGLNLKKKHMRPSQQNPKGGIVEIEAPIHISNVAVCGADGKRLKLKVERDKNGVGTLYSVKGKERQTYRSLKSAK